MCFNYNCCLLIIIIAHYWSRLDNGNGGDTSIPVNSSANGPVSGGESHVTVSDSCDRESSVHHEHQYR